LNFKFKRKVFFQKEIFVQKIKRVYAKNYLFHFVKSMLSGFWQEIINLNFISKVSTIIKQAIAFSS